MRKEDIMKKTQSRFSRAERQAYMSGMGYAVGHKKKGINFSKPSLRRSFAAGYAKGLERIERNPLKYPALPPKKRTTKKK